MRTFISILLFLMMTQNALACNCVSGTASGETLMVYRGITLLLSFIPIFLLSLLIWYMKNNPEIRR